MLLLSERSLAGEREDALIRASCLARAVYLRVLEARQDIAAILYSEERDGDIFLEARPLPWSRARTQLYYSAPKSDEGANIAVSDNSDVSAVSDVSDDVGEMRVLPPGGYTNGQPFWRLPGRLAEGYTFFLTTEEGRMRGDRILPGINGLLRKELPAERPKIRRGEEFREDPWAKTDFAASQRFFARQRMFDKLRPEFAILQNITQKDFAAVSLLVVSDNTTVFAKLDAERPAQPWMASRRGAEKLDAAAAAERPGASQSVQAHGAPEPQAGGKQDAEQRGAAGAEPDAERTVQQPGAQSARGVGLAARAHDIQLLSFFASQEANLARAFFMEGNMVRAICGYDQSSGLVVVDLQYIRALPPLELGLSLISVFIPFAAIFVFAQSRGIERKYLLFMLFVFVFAAGFILTNEALSDYEHRSRETEIFKKDFAEYHLEGDHPIRQAHAALFRDFALADMNSSPSQGKLGIYCITIGTQALTLFGVYALSVLFGVSAFGYYGRQRIWGRLAIVLLGMVTLFALFGAIFLASSEHYAVSDSGIADLAMTMAIGLLLLLGQIVIAFPLSVLLASLNRVIRGTLLAFFFLPFFLSPLFYEFITRFIIESGQARPALWYGLRFFAVLPVTILGFVYAAKQIPRHSRDFSDFSDFSEAARFAGVGAFFRCMRFTLPARFLSALPVFAFSYYLLLEPWPGRFLPGSEAVSLTQLAQAGHSMPLCILFVTIILFVIFLRSAARRFSQDKESWR